jgi:hypothetical protein
MLRSFPWQWLPLAIEIGVLANTLVKLLIGTLVGAQPFRKRVAFGLSGVAWLAEFQVVWLR